MPKQDAPAPRASPGIAQGWYRGAGMRTVAALPAGIIIGAALALGTVALSGSWYEYHILVGNESPITLVNERGWELVRQDGQIWQFRRPRFRLH